MNLQARAFVANTPNLLVKRKVLATNFYFNDSFEVAIGKSSVRKHTICRMLPLQSL